MAEHLKIMNKRMVLLNPKFANKRNGKSEEKSIERKGDSINGE